MIRKILILLTVMCLLSFAGCLLVPSPELPATVPPMELADSNSQFADVMGLQLHYKKRGNGKPIFLLLHGFGASLYTWQDIMTPLASSGTAIAYDRPAFGLTERPLDWREWNPYSSSAQVDIALSLLDKYAINKAIIIGNSAGGTIAAQISLRAPNRVSALILVSPAFQRSRGMPDWVTPLFRLPLVRSLGLKFIRSSFQKSGSSLLEIAWHDPTKLTLQTTESYELPLRANNWDLGLWNFILANDTPSDLALRLTELKQPILIVTGDDDRIIPTDDSVRLAEEIGAQLEILDSCGHVPQEECPIQFLRSINKFINELEDIER